MCERQLWFGEEKLLRKFSNCENNLSKKDFQENITLIGEILVEKNEKKPVAGEHLSARGRFGARIELIFAIFVFIPVNGHTWILCGVQF